MRLLFAAGGLALLAVTLFLAGQGLREGLSLLGWLHVGSLALAAMGGLVPKVRKVIYVAAAMLLVTATLSYFLSVTGA